MRFVAARKRNFESNIDFCFPFSQESGWPLGTRILRTVFVFVIKQKRVTKNFLENPFTDPSRKRKLGFGYHFPFSVFARNVKLKTNIKFSFSFSQKSRWPLGTRILKSVFVVDVKRKHEIGISFKIRFLVLHATDFDKNPFSGPVRKRILEMECRLLLSVSAGKRLALGYTHSKAKVCRRSTMSRPINCRELNQVVIP